MTSASLVLPGVYITFTRATIHVYHNLLQYTASAQAVVHWLLDFHLLCDVAMYMRYRGREEARSATRHNEMP